MATGRRGRRGGRGARGPSLVWPRVCTHPHRAGRRRAGSGRRCGRRRRGGAHGRRGRRRVDRGGGAEAARRAFRRSSSRSGSATTRRRPTSAAPQRSTPTGSGSRRRPIFARYDSLEAKLGAAFAAWPASEDRIEQLGALYPAELARAAPRRAVPLLGRHERGADRLARGARRRAGYAVRGPSGRLHPRAGLRARPAGFVVSFDYRIEGKTPAEQLHRLAADRTLRGRLLYGIALAATRPPRLGAPRLRGGAEDRAEQRRRARRRCGRSLRQGKSVGVVLPSRPAQPPLPARGDGALPPRGAAALAEERQGGDTPARAGAQGRAGEQDRRRGEALPRCEFATSGPPDPKDGPNGLWRSGAAFWQALAAL